MEWLKGKKTYIVAGIGILVLVLQTLAKLTTGEAVDWNAFAGQLVPLILALTIRSGIEDGVTTMRATMLTMQSKGK